jgi:hypothetical protein
MALWCDPLDELIADLERTLPAVSQSPATDWSTLLVGSQLLGHALIRGTPNDVKLIKQDPRVRTFLAHLETLRADWCRRSSAPDADDNSDEHAQAPKAR